MSQIKKKSRTFYQYAAMYFVALFILSCVIMFSVLRFSAGKLVSLETQNTQNSMQRAADILDKQFQSLEAIAVQIGAQSDYRPESMKNGPLHDIALLEDFKRYANYSPLAEKYFLVYSDRDKIYLSEGSTSYFRFYATANLGVPGERVDDAFRRITEAKRPDFERSGQKLLMVFPTGVYFKSDPRSVTLCFELTQNQIRQYLEQMSIGLPDQYVISMNGKVLLSGEADGDAELTAMMTNANYLEVASSRGSIVFSAVPQLEGWHLLFSRNIWLLLAAVVCLLMAALLSALLAKVSLRPLDNLLKKYMPDNSRIENQFHQLDEILSNMDQMHSNTRTLLRNQLLNMMLRGNYNEGLVKRWSMLDIVFSHLWSCVYLIDTGAEDRQRLIGRLEAMRDRHHRVYTTELADEEKLIVIVNYDDTLSVENIRRKIGLMAGDAQVYVGIPVDSPKRLSLSFMAAMTESRYGVVSPRQSTTTADQLAARLITAAESGNAHTLDGACEEALEFLSTEPLNGLLTKHNIYELISSTLRKAEEGGLKLDKAAVNALVLLPDAGMVVSDLRKLLLAGVDAAERRKAAHDDTSRLIVEYVIANAFDPDINLQSMSEEFGLSADYISSMIKRETGAAFKEYLTMLRIGEARRLLAEDPTLTVNDVALKVGYRKASNFSKKFKELTGVLPSQIKQ